MLPQELLMDAMTVMYDKTNDAVDSLHNKLRKENREGEIAGDGAGSSRGGSPSGTPPTGPRYVLHPRLLFVFCPTFPPTVFKGSEEVFIASYCHQRDS